MIELGVEIAVLIIFLSYIFREYLAAVLVEILVVLRPVNTIADDSSVDGLKHYAVRQHSSTSVKNRGIGSDTTADGVHINAQGYECWKNSIEDYIY